MPTPAGEEPKKEYKGKTNTKENPSKKFQKPSEFQVTI
jgi:hypothetical protein